MTKGLTAHQKKFLTTLKRIIKPYCEKVEEISFTINPNVFPPATDTRVLARNIKGVKGKRVLDLTTGAGVLAVIAGLQGASGVAADIHQDAVNNALENINKFKVKFDVIRSDLFKNIPLQKFDLIVSNGPFSDGIVNHPLEYAMLGAKKYIRNLFKDIKPYMKSNGQLLIVYADWSSEKNYLERTILKNHFTFSIIDAQKSADGKRAYNVYKIKK